MARPLDSASSAASDTFPPLPEIPELDDIFSTIGSSRDPCCLLEKEAHGKSPIFLATPLNLEAPTISDLSCNRKIPLFLFGFVVNVFLLENVLLLLLPLLLLLLLKRVKRAVFSSVCPFCVAKREKRKTQLC